MGRAAKVDQFDADFVAKAKDFERAAKHDLEQYRNWLDHYAVTDQKDRRKHERRLRREQARYRREVRLRYARRLAHRYSSATLRAVRATIAAIWKATAISAVLLLLFTAVAGKWIVARVQAIALAAVRAARAANAWVKPRARRLAIRSRRRTGRALDWIALQTARQAEWSAIRRKQARAFAEMKASQAFAVTRTKGSEALAFTSAKGSQAFAFTSAQATAGARATSHAAATGYTWSVARAQDCARAVPPMMRASRRGALRARRFTRVNAFRLRDRAALQLATLRGMARRAVSGMRAAHVPQPAMKMLTFQPARGALVPVEPPCTALTVIEPAPWTGAAERGINITAPEADAALEPQAERKPRAVKARPRKARRGPRRKQHQNPAAPGKPRPRGKKRPRIS